MITPYSATADNKAIYGHAQRALDEIEGNRPVALAFDGTLEALLTCIFVAFSAHAPVEDIAQGKQIQMRLGQQVVTVLVDMDAATRVKRTIMRSLGPDVWRTIVVASASDELDKGMVLYRFLKATLTNARTAPCKSCSKKPTCETRCNRIPPNRILDAWGNADIEPLLSQYRSVVNEIDKMRNFIRFEQVEGDMWFACCNPNSSVVPFVMNHFAQRFNTQRFVIYDEVHHIAGVSEHGRWQLLTTDHIAPPSSTQEEADMQDAWRRFYRALSIDERYHPELRRNFIPKRLWRNITELQDETS